MTIKKKQLLVTKHKITKLHSNDRWSFKYGTEHLGMCLH